MSFSVLMSVYKGETDSNLRDCFNSLANQTLKADEVILVEDGPISKNLKTTIEEYREKLNIKSVVLSKNHGLANALNEGLRQCSHELIARMDTDDIACPERFKLQVSYMNATKLSVCSGIIEEWDEDFSHLLSIRRLPTDHADIRDFSKVRCPVSHPACMYKKVDVQSVGGYPLVYPEDHLLWIKMIQNGSKFGNLDKVLVKMRTGSDFLSRRGWRFLKGQLETYKYMYKTEYISTYEYFKVCALMSVLRMSPKFLKSLMYKVGR